jgi:hypothetical protein
MHQVFNRRAFGQELGVGQNFKIRVGAVVSELDSV